jgi:tetratricopeptide (TPR) repeat protein
VKWRATREAEQLMADESWYRRRTWSSDDKAAFFARLRRSRSGFHKAQYCRTQAYELQQARHFKEALNLLDFAIAEWPNDREPAIEYLQRAECLEQLGDKTAAVIAYREALEAQRRKPSVLTNAHLEFALLVALTPFPGCYDEALSVLTEFRSGWSFPFEVFNEAAARSLIARAKGNSEEASRQANAAIEAAAREHSGFSRHPQAGLVANVQPGLMERLRRLA